jgi:hypothetical protein
VQQRAIAILRRSTLLTALDTSAGNARPTRAYDAATILHIFAGPTRTAAHMPTSAALPDTITPHTRACRHTRRDKPHAARRHVSIMARVTQNSASARNIAHSHAAYKHTSPARPHDVPLGNNHCALRNHHCTHTAAHAPHTARHTAPTTPHAAHRKSHPVTHAASAPHLLQSHQVAQP